MCNARFARMVTTLSQFPHSAAEQGDEKEVRELLYEAERRSEILLGYLRVAAFVVLVAMLGVLDFPGPHYSHVLSDVVYGTATIASLILAWFRYHRPWFAWLMTTL